MGNFYQRRWHDYDYTRGEARKQGDGETNADKPWPEDLPGDNDNMPKKKPLKPLPIIPKAKEQDKKADEKPKKPEPKKPTVPKQPATPKNPKAKPTQQKPDPKKPEPPKREKKNHSFTPEQIRRRNDQDYLNKIITQRDIHQVIDMKKEYTWLTKDDMNASA